MTGVHICLENYKIFLFFFVQCIPKTVQLVKKNRLEPALSHLSHIYFLILEFSNIFQELILHFLFPSDHYQPDFTLAWEIHFQFAIFCIRKISIMEVKQVSSKLNRVNAVRLCFLQEMFQKLCQQDTMAFFFIEKSTPSGMLRSNLFDNTHGRFLGCSSLETKLRKSLLFSLVQV